MLTSAEVSRGVLGKYIVDVDVTSFRNSAAIGRVDGGVTSSSPAEPKNNIRFLPSDTPIIEFDDLFLKVTSFGNYVTGVDTYYGSINGSEKDTFVLSVMDDRLYGYLHRGELVLEVRFEESLSAHSLSILDLAKLPKDDDSLLIESSNGRGRKSIGGHKGRPTPIDPTISENSIGGNGNIRVLVIYTEDVGNENNIYTLTANIFAEMDASLDQSDVDPDVVVYSAGLVEEEENFDGLCKDEIWQLAKDRDDPFDTLDSRLASNDADVALIIVTEESNGCSAPYKRIGGIAGAIFDSDQPFAITMDTYALGDRTAAHELGHVFGGHHEVEYLDDCLNYHSMSYCYPEGEGTESYAMGYVSSSEEWQTIMGGYYACDFVALPGTPDCVRVNKWSNPAIYYMGEATGVTNESDMQSALEAQATTVAAWDTYPSAAPSSAPTLTVVPGLCFGANTLSWTSVSGADHYQVFQSASSGFSGSSRISVQTTRTLIVDIDYMDTQYFRVRACNGSGCGSYSSIKSASYYNGCI